MTRLDKIKKIVSLDSTDEYIRQARASASAVEAIMQSDKTDDEKRLDIWEFFKSIDICSEAELTNVT